MSGHSHWAGIKHKKGLADAKRSKLFSKFARELTIAARQGGDPSINTVLRAIIEKAKDINMPSENITRAIKRGTGEETGARLEEVLLEAYGPGGAALLIKGITDNRNRMLGEVKQILARHQGKLAEGGSVRWMFEQKGVIIISPNPEEGPAAPKEELELAAIEAGAQDLYWHEDTMLDIYTIPTQLEETKKKLQERRFAIEDATLDWVPKERIALDEQNKKIAQELFDALDESEDVQEIYSNLK
ncbi:MAG: YebC/PmpR family DNA-binding transcriptional regulator [Candidatus Wildermuthbacteria bacterium]|nr:YebC/PmpR family DNA-binding transcriptional regulator [Candidatus Wildermuthbacteria bacterium]